MKNLQKPDYYSRVHTCRVLGRLYLAEMQDLGSDYRCPTPRYKDDRDIPEPTIIMLVAWVDYSPESPSSHWFKASWRENATPHRDERQSGVRKLILICFNRVLKDSLDPKKSELLRELDMLGLEPEGIAELYAVNDYYDPILHPNDFIVARRDIWVETCDAYHPFLSLSHGGDKRIRHTFLGHCRGRWDDGRYWFVCSRKRK